MAACSTRTIRSFSSSALQQLVGRLEYSQRSPASAEQPHDAYYLMHHHPATAGHEAGHEKRRHLFAADFPYAYLNVDRAKHEMSKEFTRLTDKLVKLVCDEFLRHLVFCSIHL